MIVNARDVVNVDTISNGNNKPWDRIIEYMKQFDEGTDFEFDFKGVEIYSPFGSDSFKKVISMPNFKMTIYSNEKLVESIKMMCVMNNENPDRIKLIKAVQIHVETEEEKKTKKVANDLQEYFKNDGNGHSTFNISERYTQIGVQETVNYIREAIRIYAENTGINYIELNTKRIAIQPSVIDAIAKLIDDERQYGIKLVIISDLKEIQDKIGMYRDLIESGTESNDRASIAKRHLTPGKVGIMLKYKKGRAKDDLGRYGKGEVVSTRVAVFRGFVEGATLSLKFDVYSNSRLYTRAHWYLEHDGDELKEIEHEELTVNTDEIGIYNYFIGTSFHFSTAVQYKSDGTITMYNIDDQHKVVGTEYTIPERIKAVFDDFDVEYDKDSLEAYIEETRRIIEEE